MRFMVIIATLGSLLSLAANGLVLVSVLGGAAYGWRRGLFRATVSAFAVLVSYVSALAFAEASVSVLRTLEVADGQAFWVAFFGVMGLLLYGSWAASEAFLQQESWFCDGVISRLAASVVGGVAGLLFAGSVLVGWTIMPLPRPLQFDTSRVSLDAGAFALEVFAKCIERDPKSREVLLGGRSPSGQAFPQCSEPFVDGNGNCTRDEDEGFLDWDGNGEFTPMLGIRGSSRATPVAESSWIGLIDHYRLGSWATPSFLHAPRILSPGEVEITMAGRRAGVLYEARAEDVDACDSLRFTIEQVEEPASSLMIDEVTGAVSASPEELTRPKKEYVFAITVTDKAGLQDARRVRVRVKKDEDREPASPE